MKKYEITDIQLFDYALEIQVGENEYETRYSYSANIAINNEFMVQVSGNDNEATFDGITDPAEAMWSSEEKQQAAFDTISDRDIEDYLESEYGFENNRDWLAEYPATELMNPEQAPNA